jgi:hypothetical protein
MPGVIQRFISHATGKAPIADDSYDMVIIASTITGQSHAQSC